jgi:hypothetical protein
MTPLLNPALAVDALYAKSKVYIKRGFRAQQASDSDEYQLWASLSMELLGKAALAKVHPALVVDPTHAHSLFAACGRQLSPDIKTITAKTVFDRLGHIDKTFDSRHQKFCEQIALRRNAELHSGESPFSDMASEVWEREFWGAVETILAMQGETLETWLGAKDSKTPTEIIKQAAEAMDWAVKHRISRRKEDFQKAIQDPKKRQEQVDKSPSLSFLDYSKRLNITADAWQRGNCPACESLGFLGGILWSEEVVDDEFSEDPMIEYTDETYTVEEFFCPTCQLHLFGTKEVDSAELPKEFVVRQEREREFEPDYGND